jgi:hypothetical protein
LRWSFLRDALHAGHRGDYAVKGEIPVGSASKAQVLEETASDVTKLRDAVDQAQNILIQARAVFPFDLFPDTITVDRQKLTVVHRQFWGMKQTTSVPHADITNIQADIGPLFGSLTVTSEFFINNTQTIRYLPKHDVLAIQQLVQGFILASKGDIDTSNVDDKHCYSCLVNWDAVRLKSGLWFKDEVRWTRPLLAASAVSLFIPVVPWWRPRQSILEYYERE